MATKPVSELLYDSEAALRLVDSALREFGAGIPDPAPGTTTRPPDATRTREFAIERSHLSLLDVIDRLRQGRSVLERVVVGNHARGGEMPRQGAAGDQLDNASAVLEDVEHRLSAIVATIGSGASGQQGNGKRVPQRGQVVPPPYAP